MVFALVHELPGRMRFRASRGLSAREAGRLSAALAAIPGLRETRVCALTGSVLVFSADAAARMAVCRMLGGGLAPGKTPAGPAAVPPVPSVLAAGSGEGMAGGLWPLARYIFVRPFLPLAVRAGLAVFGALPFLKKGLAALGRGHVNVDVLDAAAIGVSLLRRDVRTASLLTVLLGFGDVLAEWTRKKSLDSLAERLALNIDTVWVRRDGREIAVPLDSLRENDLVMARSGAAIAVDGVVVSGEAVVNQASLTGEPLGVRRAAGASVFAGTVVEEGELVIRATGVGDGTRLSRIVRFIEKSEDLKANIQGRAERLADVAAPFSFLLAGLVWIVTRNPARAASVLLVDYSCALRLATPLAVLSAMREGAGRGVLVKGGRFLETLASADAVVFDKTGTLTHSLPRVVEVAPAPGYERAEVLRLAACLEEHFPHPVARAVVRRAEEENLLHAEEHSEVEYVVAHGVASHLHGKRALIGSRHYVCHDEGVAVDEMDETIRAFSARGLSLLYLALDGRLAGIVGIEDPLRPEAPHLVERLRREDMRVIMLTGDDERTAGAVAARLGIAEYRAQVLPADKAGAIRALQAEGRTVIMLGDGINDSPALSAADVGVSLRDGADLAREVADVVLADGRLSDLLVARELGRAALRRIHTNFAWIMTLNTLFLAGGLIGLVPPGLSAVLHNVTTVGVTLNAMRPMLPRGRDS